MRVTNPKARPSEAWAIGYGNLQRRDDGIGPFVVEALRERLKGRRDIRFYTCHQLEPALVEELQDAVRIVFVDATLNELTNGWTCSRIHSPSDALPGFTHQVSPPFFLTLLKAVYHRAPEAWLTSIQGTDFGFGEGPTPEAEARAVTAMDVVARLLTGDRKTRAGESST